MKVKNSNIKKMWKEGLPTNRYNTSQDRKALMQEIEFYRELLKENPGNAELYFYIMDDDGQMYVNLSSRSMKVAVQKDLINYLKSQSMLEYKIN